MQRGGRFKLREHSRERALAKEEVGSHSEAGTREPQRRACPPPPQSEMEAMGAAGRGVGRGRESIGECRRRAATTSCHESFEALQDPSSRALRLFLHKEIQSQFSPTQKVRINLRTAMFTISSYWWLEECIIPLNRLLCQLSFKLFFHITSAYFYYRIFLLILHGHFVIVIAILKRSFESISFLTDCWGWEMYRSFIFIFIQSFSNSLIRLVFQQILLNRIGFWSYDLQIILALTRMKIRSSIYLKTLGVRSVTCLQWLSSCVSRKVFWK